DQTLVIFRLAEIEAVPARKLRENLRHFHVEQLVAVLVLGEDVLVHHQHIHLAAAQGLIEGLLALVQRQGMQTVSRQRLRQFPGQSSLRENPDAEIRQFSQALQGAGLTLERDDSVMTGEIGQSEQAEWLTLSLTAQGHQRIQLALLYCPQHESKVSSAV